MKPFYKIADDTFRHWENAAYAMRDDERKRHRWIPISERFPMPVDLNQQGFVLGLFDNGDVDFCGGKEAQHITTLTHWMPIPAPPENENENEPLTRCENCSHWDKSISFMGAHACAYWSPSRKEPRYTEWFEFCSFASAKPERSEG